MATRASQNRRGRRAGPLESLQRDVGSTVRDVRKAVRGQMRRLEKQANEAQIVARRRAAATLREVAKQIRRLEKAIAPPAPKRRTPKKKASSASRVRPRAAA